MTHPSPKKKIMVVGPVGAGKSTLLKALGLRNTPVRKTESVTFYSEAVDTPGEAFEIPTLYHMLIMSSMKASLILLLADPTKRRRFPSRFALSMRAPSVGVVTKIDTASEEQIQSAEKALLQCGVRKVFRLSSKTGEGMDDFRSYIAELS